MIYHGKKYRVKRKVKVSLVIVWLFSSMIYCAINSHTPSGFEKHVKCVNDGIVLYSELD